MSVVPDPALSTRRVAKSATAFRTISEVADDLEVPQHVLRFWETKFPQVKPLKRGGGRRYYRPEDVSLLRRVRQLLYQDGYTIKGVQRLLKEGGLKGPVPARGVLLPAPVLVELPAPALESEAASAPVAEPSDTMAEPAAATPEPEAQPEAELEPEAEPQPEAPAEAGAASAVLRLELQALLDELVELRDMLAAARR